MPAKVFNAEIAETVRRMTEEGYSQSRIAKEIGVHSTTIGHWQKKLKLKASNKWHFGESAKMEPIQLSEEKEKPTKPSKKFTKIVDKTLKLQGSTTKYEYVVGMHSDVLKINPGYSSDIEIDLKDLVSFANELMDVAEEIEKMRVGKD